MVIFNDIGLWMIHWKSHYSESKNTWLVGGAITILKNMKVSWGYYSQYMESQNIPWFQTSNQKKQLGNIE